MSALNSSLHLMEAARTGGLSLHWQSGNPKLLQKQRGKMDKSQELQEKKKKRKREKSNAELKPEGMT